MSDRTRASLVLLFYLAFAVAYTWPLVPQIGSVIVSDPGDPILNTTILWWNATVVPFTGAWWNPPFFYPSTGVAAFTEHLTGIGVVSTPVYLATSNPLAAYNVATLVTWPFSAFTAYLLILYLTTRHDAAFVGGLAFGFSPYRIAELGHLQALTSYWVPLILLGLHAFLETGRRQWLVLFGAAWVLQSWSNGYLMLHGAVLIGLWLVYYTLRRGRTTRLVPIVAAWIIASLPLIPVLLRYYFIHEEYGMRRSMNETLAFSAPAWGWFEVSPFIALWHRVLPEAEDKLFPGLTVVVIALGSAFAAWRKAPRSSMTHGRRRAMFVFAALAVISLIGMFAVLINGPWRVTLAGVVIRMGDIERALVVFLLSVLAMWLLTPWTRAAFARRSPSVFYGVAGLLMAALCWGPVLRAGEHVVLDPAPYRYLMYVPGFDQLRVPTRFWTLGTLCLSVVAGLGLARLAIQSAALRLSVATVAALGVIADGWLTVFPIAAPPGPWPDAQPPDRKRAVLELPLGPGWDAAATYRSLFHRRPVFNGVSGYDPSHYGPLRAGLDVQDPEMWSAIAAIGPTDIVVNTEVDTEGVWRAYARQAGQQVIADGVREVYGVSAPPMREPELGPALPIALARASRNGGSIEIIHDGRVDAEWQYPQQPGQWVVVDLGRVHDVAGITHAMGAHPHDFPRQLRIEVSTDGWTWETAWEGRTAARAFLAAVRAPRASDMPIAFPARGARFVRLRQLAEHVNLWRIAELTVHGAR